MYNHQDSFPVFNLSFNHKNEWEKQKKNKKNKATCMEPS